VEQVKPSEEVQDLWKSVNALALELPASVWEHHRGVVFRALEAQAAEIEGLRDYQSDETTQLVIATYIEEKRQAEAELAECRLRKYVLAEQLAYYRRSRL